jgi:hypothetical protein
VLNRTPESFKTDVEPERPGESQPQQAGDDGSLTY